MYYHNVMAKTGRPRTGMTPNISIRLDRDAYQQARVAAVVARKTIGKWLEDAIQEKLEREKGDAHGS